MAPNKQNVTAACPNDKKEIPFFFESLGVVFVVVWFLGENLRKTVQDNFNAGKKARLYNEPKYYNLFSC